MPVKKKNNAFDFLELDGLKILKINKLNIL